VLLPQSFRQGQAREIFVDEWWIRLDTESFEYGNHLTSMLGGVPGGAFEKLVHRRGAIEGFYGLAAGFFVELTPPSFQSFNDALAVGGDFRPDGAGAVRGRDVGVVGAVFDVVDGGFRKSFGDAKDVMAQQPDRAVAIVDGALFEPFVVELADVALGGAQYMDPLHHQFSGRKRRMTAALQTDELGDVFQVLAKNILVAIGQNRDGSSAELEQPRFRRGVVQYVEGGEVDAFFRKKLFRSQATASTRLGEENQVVAGVFHDFLLESTV